MPSLYLDELECAQPLRAESSARKITIVFFDAGGGHRNAAEALRSVLAQPEYAWKVELLNLQDLLDSVDVVRGVTGIRTQEAYNLMLRKGWTRMSPQLLLSLQGLIRLYHSRIVKLLRNYWATHPTNLVLSVIPHFNRAMAESIREDVPQVPFVTLLTDLADYPPHFWMEKESEYLICGTEKAVQQAAKLGHPPQRIFQTSGMVLKQKFYNPPAIDRDLERRALGLRPDGKTALVLFGGHGSQVMLDIAKNLDDSRHELQLIMLCGHNQKLRARLEALETRNKIVAVGFTSEVDHYMSLADFFIGKPGPGSLSEALQFNLPVIVERNSRTMPQERYNTEWLEEKRLGIVLASFDGIAAGVDQLLDLKTFNELSRNARSYTNRALFEIPEILHTVSIAKAMPMPPLTQSVATPRFSFRRSIS